MKALFLSACMFFPVAAFGARPVAPASSALIDGIDAAGSTSTDSGQYVEGTRAINEGRWSDAVAIFSQVAAARGDHADGALYWKAYAEHKQGKPGQALDTCGSLSANLPAEPLDRGVRRPDHRDPRPYRPAG